MKQDGVTADIHDKMDDIDAIRDFASFPKPAHSHNAMDAFCFMSEEGYQKRSPWLVRKGAEDEGADMGDMGRLLV